MQLSKLLALALLLSACRPAERRSVQPVERYAQDWAVDPKTPGPDSPPVGQSLFDAIVSRPVLFPFPKLLDQIEERLGGKVQYRRVLIPLGRSLQRTAAAPEFFRYPRAIVAFDAEPAESGEFFVKDRLFMGYQEKAGVIEVLSYNEVAGRFEFQLVNNYREGEAPQVQNARRALCTTCHQNHAPLFPRQLWDETNSNPSVLQLLLREQRSFYDFPLEQSADVPYQIDNAVHRANEFSTYQLLWMQGDAGMRAAWLRDMLACRLSGACEFNTAEFEAQMANWRAKWPRGLRIPNPEIPNRNPLAFLSRYSPASEAEAVAVLVARQKNIEPQFEPAAPRDPLEVWKIDPDRLQRVMAGLANFFPAADIREIGHALEQRQAEPVRYRATCTAKVVQQPRVEVRCRGGDFSMEVTLRLRNGRAAGEIGKLSVRSQSLVRDLSVTGGAISMTRDGVHGFLTVARDGSGATARCGDGNRIERIELNGSEARLLARRDFQILETAIDQLANDTRAGKTDVLESRPLRPSVVREALYEKLGIVHNKP